MGNQPLRTSIVTTYSSINLYSNCPDRLLRVNGLERHRQNEVHRFRELH